MALRDGCRPSEVLQRSERRTACGFEHRVSFPAGGDEPGLRSRREILMAVRYLTGAPVRYGYYRSRRRGRRRGRTTSLPADATCWGGIRASSGTGSILTAMISPSFGFIIPQRGALFGLGTLRELLDFGREAEVSGLFDTLSGRGQPHVQVSAGSYWCLGALAAAPRASGWQPDVCRASSSETPSYSRSSGRPWTRSRKAECCWPCRPVFRPAGRPLGRGCTSGAFKTSKGSHDWRSTLICAASCGQAI